MTKLPAGQRMKWGPHQEHVLRFGPWTKVGTWVQNSESASPCSHGGEVLKLKASPDGPLYILAALTDRESGKYEVRTLINR
ncbi:uncharacterized protein PgNI_11754 [Pyricularia grisea]|uniref:Uncharacterized protein n=1 Tax=Pyricularia grisea TaxID=148305 RepID=A0A6P8ANX1_PYRGI|nr:uncharacterized protein PgNI_11754 [Pyricularia grisea]TLD03739.1 hypothetical protein PgNI_11754 [Pyricularia grisea]